MILSVFLQTLGAIKLFLVQIITITIEALLEIETLFLECSSVFLGYETGKEVKMGETKVFLIVTTIE